MTPCTPAGVPAARQTRAKPTWPIDEYAISRLKFACPMAANEPSAIDMIEMKTMICCHCVVIAGNAVMMTRTVIATAATFGAAAKNAVTGVGAPS